MPMIRTDLPRHLPRAVAPQWRPAAPAAPELPAGVVDARAQQLAKVARLLQAYETAHYCHNLLYELTDSAAPCAAGRLSFLRLLVVLDLDREVTDTTRHWLNCEETKPIYHPESSIARLSARLFHVKVACRTAWQRAMAELPRAVQ